MPDNLSSASIQAANATPAAPVSFWAKVVAFATAHEKTLVIAGIAAIVLVVFLTAVGL